MILKCRCGKEYRIKDKRAQSGERFKCTKCGKSIQVPFHFAGPGGGAAAAAGGGGGAAAAAGGEGGGAIVRLTTSA